MIQEYEKKKSPAEAFGGLIGRAIFCWTICNVVLKREGIVEMTWGEAFEPLLWMLLISLTVLGLAGLIKGSK